MKTLIKIIILSLSIMLISSCDYVELRNVSFVNGMTIDKSDIGFEINFEIIYSTDETARDYAFYGTKGKTFLDCIVNISKITSGVLDYNHNKIIIISEELALEGIDYIIDALYKNSSFKNNILILVSKGCKAKDIIFTKSITEKSLSNEIFLSLDKSNQNFPKSRKVTLHDFYNFNHSKKISQVLPSIGLEELNGENVVSLEGLGLFENSKLQDFLTGEESQHLSLIDNYVKSSALVINHEDSDFGLCIVKNTTKKSYNKESNSFEFITTIAVSFKDFYTTEIPKIEAIAISENYLKSKISELHQKYLTYDLYSIREYLYHNNYNTYKNIDNFQHFLSDLNVEFKVNIKLHDQGATTYE